MTRTKDIRNTADVFAKQHESLTGAAVYYHTVLVYDYLYGNSEVNENGERLFIGSISKVINEIAPSKRYYSPIRNLLESPPENPCIQVYQRGTGKQPSILRLMRPPPGEWAETPHADRLTRAPVAVTMGVDIERDGHDAATLAKMLNSLKGVNLQEVLSDHERRLSRLESQTESN